MSPSSLDEMLSITVQLKVFGSNAKAVFDYENGIMRNFLIYVAKPGSTMHGLIQLISKLASTVLRKEKKLDKIIERLEELEPFEPSGFCSVGKDKHFRCESYAEFLIVLLKKYWEYDGKIE